MGRQVGEPRLLRGLLTLGMGSNTDLPLRPRLTLSDQDSGVELLRLELSAEELCRLLSSAMVPCTYELRSPELAGRALTQRDVFVPELELGTSREKVEELLTRSLVQIRSWIGADWTWSSIRQYGNHHRRVAAADLDDAALVVGEASHYYRMTVISWEPE